MVLPSILLLNLIYFMRFSTKKQLHINDHLKAQLGYKSCPRTLGTEDLLYGGTRTHDFVVDESSTLTTRPSAPLSISSTYCEEYDNTGHNTHSLRHSVADSLIFNPYLSMLTIIIVPMLA